MAGQALAAPMGSDSKRPAFHLTFGIALLLFTTAFLAPPASAAQVYFEGFESGTGQWTPAGDHVLPDCTVSASGSCSLLITAACCGRYATARDPVSIGMSAATTVRLHFRAASIQGGSDAGYGVLLDTGYVSGELTRDGPGGNNVVTLSSAGGGSSEIQNWAWNANAWHTLDIILDPDADTVRAVLDGSASTGTLSIPATAATITELSLYGIDWSGASIRYYFDAISVDVATFQCNDGADNDGDGAADFPGDPGCASGSDNSEGPNPQCSDGVDNDQDGAVDLADRSCSDSRDNDEANPVQCADGHDNDGDGWIDFGNDPGCSSALDNTESPNPQCSDGANNDADAWTDFPDDPGCSSYADTSESPNPACSDAVDNDGDGDVDYPADKSCASARDDDELNPVQCGDGADNDGDGWKDYPEDPGCASVADTTENPNPQCSDGVDNDGDGKTDFPADPGCADRWDATEAPNPQCGDGVDNDQDGAVDLADASCSSARDDDELSPTQCADGRDNDADGWTDYPNDPGCGSALDNAESPNPQCSDGQDNDQDGVHDFPDDKSCDSRLDDDEASPAQCADAVDNDGDGRTDHPDDPGCSSVLDNSEGPNPQCSDGVDNDGDGWTDAPADPGCMDPRDAEEREGVLVPAEDLDHVLGLVLPAISTPRIEPGNVTTPAVTLPATCELPACSAPTPVPSQTVTTPEVPSVWRTTDPIPVHACVPLVLCVDFTVPGQTIGPTPGVGPQTVTTPNGTVPAACAVASAACLPATTILGPQSIPLPVIESTPLTPIVSVWISTTGFTGSVGAFVDQGRAIGPFPVTVPTPLGPVTFTVCQDTCPAPLEPQASLQGTVTVEVRVGEDVRTWTVPVDL